MRQRFRSVRFTKEGQSQYHNITPDVPTWMSLTYLGKTLGRARHRPITRGRNGTAYRGGSQEIVRRRSAFFVFNGTTPDLKLMQEQHLSLARTYEKLGIKVHYSSWSEEIPRSAYGPMKRSISAAAGFVINGGAIIPREATPYRRGRSRYVSQFLIGLGCPILYTVHGNGVCEIGASTRMSDDFIVLMLSTDCNREGADQVTPVLQRAGYKEVHLAHSPGPPHAYHDEVPGWMHSDMWIVPLDAKLALIYPPWCDYEDYPATDAIGYDLIECPREEIDLFPTNAITVEPRRVVMNSSAQKTKRLLKEGMGLRSSASNTTKSTNTAAAFDATQCSSFATLARLRLLRRTRGV